MSDLTVGRISFGPYTPGPWRRGIGNDSRTVFGAQGNIVADRVGTTDGHLVAAAPDLLAGCNALLGLLQLVLSRDDVPQPIREALTRSHRIEEAQAAVAKVEGRS